MKLNLSILLLAFALFTSSQAKAEVYIGALGGYGTSSGSSYTNSGGFAWGGTAGIQLVPTLGVAVTYINDSLKRSDNVGVTESQILGELNFFSILFLPSGVHVGNVMTSTSGYSGSTSDLGFGAHTGFEFNLVQNVTIGVAVYYTYVTTQNDHHSLIDILVPLKFHF
jgi:opacity protein-like surface antigen